MEMEVIFRKSIRYQDMNIPIAFGLFFVQLTLVQLLSIDWIKHTKILKDKIKQVYLKTGSFKNDSVSIGQRPFGLLDYPGNDIKKLELIETLWNEYYECLVNKANWMSSDKIIPPYATAAFTETSTQLECAVCVSPEDMDDKVEWYVTTQPYDPKPFLVEEDEHKQIAPYTFALQFFNLKPYHAGVYNCKLRNDYDAPHFLHVLTSDEEPVQEVKPRTSKSGPYAVDPLRIPNSKMVLWPDWTTGTNCNYCGQIGKKYKIGYCMISLIDNLPDDIRSTVQNSQYQSVIPANIIEETEHLLKIFMYGIPCRSPLLPKEVLNDTGVNEFPSQILVALCKEPCPTDVIVEVFDKDGNVKETYNNTAGEYYIHQDLPQNEQGAERITLYANKGKPFIIPCPSNYINAPVDWSVEGKSWLKGSIESISKNRITLNNLNEIVIRRVEDVDVKIYSCWINRKLVGVVRLLLNEEPSVLKEYLLTLEMYPMLMISTITITIMYISIKMCLNRTKARIGAMVGVKRKPDLIKIIKNTYHDKYTERPKTLLTTLKQRSN